MDIFAKTTNLSEQLKNETKDHHKELGNSYDGHTSSTIFISAETLNATVVLKQH